MRTGAWLLFAAAASVAGVAHGQAAASAQPAAAQAARDVTSYPATFFAEARPNTAMDMINRLPGFTFDGGAQVRGYAGAAGNVIVDGQRPTTKDDDLETLLRRIPASQVERIDIIRGGAPGIDMQGQTVLVNVIRKKNGGTTIVASPVLDYLPKDGREMPSVRLELTRRVDGREFEASLSYFTFWDDGVGGGPHTQTSAPDCAATCDGRLSAKAGGKQYILTSAYETPLAGGDFKVNALLFGQNYLDREATSGTPSSFDDRTRATQDKYKGEFGIHYTKDLRQDLNLELVALQQGQRNLAVSDYAHNDLEHYREGDTLTESILRGVLHYRPLPSLTIDGSVEGAYNLQGTSTVFDQNGVSTSLAGGDARVIERRGEAALGATWTPSPRYTLEVGVKLETSKLTASGSSLTLAKSLLYPKPRVVLTWSPTPNDQVRVRFERVVGQLDFSSFVAASALNTSNTVQLGNADLLPQDAWVSELALERKFWKTGDLTVTLRHSDIGDAVDRIPDPSGQFDEPGNIGHATENELIAGLTAPLDRFLIKNGLLKVQATWRDTTATDPTTHTERPLSKIHPFDGELDFTQDLTSLKSTWGVSVNGHWNETYYRFNEIDRYKLGDFVQVSYEYKPTSKLSVRLELNNVTNRPFEQSFTAYPGPRPAAPSSIDWRSYRSGPEIHLRLRKTFG